jgi:hypothetical protein
VIPPVFYVLVGLVSVRPLSILSVLASAGRDVRAARAARGGDGRLFMIPDLLDYGAAGRVRALGLTGGDPVAAHGGAADLCASATAPVSARRRAPTRVWPWRSAASETPPIAAPSRPLGAPATDCAGADSSGHRAGGRAESARARRCATGSRAALAGARGHRAGEPAVAVLREAAGAIEWARCRIARGGLPRAEPAGADAPRVRAAGLPQPRDPQ